MTTTTTNPGFVSLVDGAEHIILAKSKQAWTYADTRLLNKNGRKTIMRVVIKRDAYNEQSYGSLEAWTEENGWKTFHSQPIDTLPAERISAYTYQTDINMKLFIESADMLWAIAEPYFGAK